MWSVGILFLTPDYSPMNLSKFEGEGAMAMSRADSEHGTDLVSENLTKGTLWRRKHSKSSWQELEGVDDSG